MDLIKFREYLQILDGDSIYPISNQDKGISQPDDIKLELKKYQKATIYQMFLREYRSGFFVTSREFWETNVGILGEGVGVGKTFITLGLITYMKNMKYYNPSNPSASLRLQILKKKLNLNVNPVFLNNIVDYIPTYDNNINIIKDFYLKTPDQLYIQDGNDYTNIKNINCNLIVLPHNLIQQWRDDIVNHTKLKYFYIGNIRDIRKLSQPNALKSLSEYDLVLCNASKYNQLIDLTKEYRWERVFFDEAHSINIPKSKFVSAKFYWFITATYKSIISRGNTGFLKTLFVNYNRKLRQHGIFNFNKFILKTDHRTVKQEFQLEKPQTHRHLSEKPLWIQILDCALTTEFPKLREMMYAELHIDIKEFLKTYEGGILHSEKENKNVILLYIKWLKCREENYKNRNTYARHELTNLLSLQFSSGNNANRIRLQIDRKRDYIQSLTNRENNYTNLRNIIKIKINEFNLCWGCLTPMTQHVSVGSVAHNCKHSICLECAPKFNNWKTQYTYWGIKCFFCNNHELFIGNDIKTIITPINNNPTLLLNTKLENMYSLLNNHDGNKRFLIFSNYSSLFKKYLDDFKKNDVKYGILKGNNNVINKRLRDFKSGKTNVLLLNGKHYGSGLNLQDATDIIITHKITEDVETQIVGRANRMGRIGRLNIHYITFEGEFT